MDAADEISTTPNDDKRNAYQGNIVKCILDAVREATENNKKKGDKWGILGYVVGEIWDGSDRELRKWYGDKEGESLYSYFDFPTYYYWIQAYTEEWNGMKSDNFYNIQYASDMLTKIYPEWSHSNCFIGNHDLFRIGNLIRKRWKVSLKDVNYWNIHYSLQAYQYMYQGPITVYYGEELGELVECYYNTGDCSAYDDCSGRTNITPLKKLSSFQKEHLTK